MVDFAKINAERYRLNMCKRIEERAKQTLIQHIQLMTDFVIVDPLKDKNLPDHEIWLDMLMAAREKNECELWSRLFYVRGGGTMMADNPEYALSGKQPVGWPYIFKPMLGVPWWDNIEVFNREMTDAFAGPYMGKLKNVMREVWHTRKYKEEWRGNQ